MSGILIVAGEAGFHHLDGEGNPDWVDIWGMYGVFAAGRFHYETATAGWLAEDMFTATHGRTVLAETVLTDNGEDGLGAGDLLAFTGANFASLREGVMTYIGTMSLTGGRSVMAEISATSDIYIGGSGEGESLFVDAAAALTPVAARRGIEFQGSEGVDLFDPEVWYLEWRGGALRKGLVADGAGGDDVLVGTGLKDRIFGGDGNDRVNGAEGGRDRLFGEAGDDTIEGGGQLNGGEGNDHIVSFSDDPVTAYGGTGNDYVWVDDGNDLVSGENGHDTLRGYTGKDTVYGGRGDDEVSGEDDADSLFGGDGVDALFGGEGSDTVEGGLGADWMEGGEGRDFFVWRSVAEATTAADEWDYVDLFERGRDKLDFRALDMALDVDGVQLPDPSLIVIEKLDSFPSTFQIEILDQAGGTAIFGIHVALVDEADTFLLSDILL